MSDEWERRKYSLIIFSNHARISTIISNFTYSSRLIQSLHLISLLQSISYIPSVHRPHPRLISSRERVYSPIKLNLRISLLYLLDIFLEKHYTLLGSDSLEAIDTSTRKEGIIYCEAWIFRSCTNESHDSLLHKWKENILLRFHPTMDLIEEQNSLTPRGKILSRSLNYLHDIFFFWENSWEMVKFTLRKQARKDCRERSFSTSRRSIKNDGRNLSRLDITSHRFSFPDEMFLTDHIIESERAEERGKWGKWIRHNIR